MTMRFVCGVLTAAFAVIPRATLAQTTGQSAEESRIFVDVNLSGAYRPLAKDRTYTSLFVVHGEHGAAHATYPRPSRSGLSPLVDVGGGYMLTRALGVGVSFGRSSHEGTVGIGATIPDPVFLNASARHSGVTDRALARTEAATNVFLAWVVRGIPRSQLRVFGGPTFFSYTAEMVKDVSYTQAFSSLAPQNAITITGFESGHVRANAIGFHVGADVTYFFTQVIGVGAGVRVSRGTVTVDEEPLSKTEQLIRVGRTLGFVGVRVRFGR